LEPKSANRWTAGRNISASRRLERLAKDTSSDTASAIKTAEIILLRPRPDHPQSNLAAYTGCQVEVELLSGLY